MIHLMIFIWVNTVFLFSPLKKGSLSFAESEWKHIFVSPDVLRGVENVFMYDNGKYFMHVLADLNYANGKRAAIKVIIKL